MLTDHRTTLPGRALRVTQKCQKYPSLAVAHAAFENAHGDKVRALRGAEERRRVEKGEEAAELS